MTMEERLAAAEARLVALSDRDAIRECLYAYCRGIDRADEAALRSAYWPDATDRHGPYSGTASGFIDWAVAKLREGGRLVHMLGNVSIDLCGDGAAVESYFQAFQADRDGEGRPRETVMCGRYIDRFEQRGASEVEGDPTAVREWRVAARTVTYDWIREAPGPTGTDAERFGVRMPVGARKPDDPWYQLLATMPRQQA